MANALDPNPATVPGGVGAAVPRVDGPLKVTGGARYASDMGVTNPVYAYFHTSAIALGRITAIDEREARALPGVIDVMTWRNPPGRINVLPLGIAQTTMQPLQSPNIRHDGEIVALVLAESYEVARDASHRLKVTYDRNPPTATFGDPGLIAEDAAKADPKFEHSVVGDAATAFAAAPVKIDQRYATPTQHHNQLELYTTTAQWEGDELTIYEPSQFMVGNQNVLAAYLGLDPTKVRFISHYVGGAFGGRGLGSRVPLIALAAKQLKRPVKLVATRDQGFTLSTYRAETRHRVRLGATSAGKITSLIHEGEEISSRPDGYKVGGTRVTARMYDIANIDTKVAIEHADRSTPGFMRAPPEVPYMFALESAMD